MGITTGVWSQLIHTPNESYEWTFLILKKEQLTSGSSESFEVIFEDFFFSENLEEVWPILRYVCKLLQTDEYNFLRAKQLADGKGRADINKK